MAVGGTNQGSGVPPVGGLLPPENVIFGSSRAMSLVRQKAEKVASTNVAVLVEGEGGTGKELIARWIHARSPRCSGPFIKVNCAAIPGALLESELFGYEKGAFTGAYNRKPGRVEQADTGTLFLDEIGDLDLSLQSKLLHFLQDGRFTRIGDTSERRVDIRLICATNRNLAAEIESGRFRADLFYRINVVQVRLPRLRERSEDLPVLAEYFRAVYMQQFERECEPLSPEVIGYLSSLSWPGNVREFSNGIARYVLIGAEATLAPESRPRRLPEGGTIPLKRLTKEAVREMERRVIMEALNANQWNRRKTAEALKISYRALIYKIRDAGLSQRQAPAPPSAAVTVAANPSRRRPLPRR
jgi:two-component system, NtrC family, response regulator AtoC